MSEIITRELSVGYDKKIIIGKIGLEVKAGKIVVLIGPNGAGKSTILKTIAGFLKPVGGAVYFDGKSSEDIGLQDRAKLVASMMTSGFGAEYMTVSDVVAGGRYPYTGLLGKLSSEDEKEIKKALSIVGASEHKDREFNKLSDGQKQRVLLARAIAQKSKFMILDEPTSFLDIGYKLSFIEILKDLATKENIGIIMSLHELEMAAKVADTVVCIADDGKIDKIGNPKDVFKNQYIEQLFNVKPGLLKETYCFEKIENPIAQVKAKLENKKAHFLMVQGTMSSAGKSLVVAGLCRIFMQDGYRVAPFKSQNMALNSFITEEGLEMGRAQVMQAEAAGVKPSVYMNPILLKPTSDSGSQIIVNGKVRGNMRARDYFEYKTELVPDILAAVDRLQQQADIIVIEGAGSPAEINLKSNDIVNMGMAAMVDAPVLLVGDIDRGGVFAQLLGTIELLDKEERQRVKGLIVNKFRGDKTILDPGLEMLEKRGGIPIAGVVPYMRLALEDEDSLSEKFDRNDKAPISIGVIKLPHIANFTDFDAFEQIPDIGIHYITGTGDVDAMDMIIIPGSKNTISDMVWLKESGIESEVIKYSSSGRPVMGICGGYQMLGKKIRDPLGVENGGEINGLGLLPVETVLTNRKYRSQVIGTVVNPTGILSKLSGKRYEGYEIHMGETKPIEGNLPEYTSNGSGYCSGNVWGTYVHGIFDSADIVTGIVEILAKEKNIDVNLSNVTDYKALKEKEYDRLADTMREYMDMELIYQIMGMEDGKAKSV
ncbi:MAG: cobyric acid synthase [Lachnospiraceae bacterium]|nr:cobyric acid synthase [Candidatus Merdinaster equi]